MGCARRVDVEGNFVLLIIPELLLLCTSTTALSTSTVTILLLIFLQLITAVKERVKVAQGVRSFSCGRFFSRMGRFSLPNNGRVFGRKKKHLGTRALSQNIILNVLAPF